MAHTLASPGDLSSGARLASEHRSAAAAFGHWLAEMLNHAFGNPREEALHQPPLVGVQPYRDRPRRRHRL